MTSASVTLAPAARAGSEPAIGVRGQRVERGGNPVLRDVSIEIAAGKVTGLLGSSGSGKTTLMRAIVGVQVVERGEIEVLGRPAGTPELRRRVAYVTQAPSLYFDLTVHENLAYFASVLGLAAGRVDEAIGTVDLVEQADQVVRTLSGGERARASLATALLGEPELLVLDEPTVGLDPVLRRDLWRTFHHLADAGVTLARLEPRHGRGRSLRLPALDARRADRRDRLSRGVARAHPSTRSRGRVPGHRGGDMSARITFATAGRVLRQLRRDPRTIALVLVVPPMMLTLFHFVLDGEPRTFDRIGPPLVGIFPLISMFLVTSIAMLRERTSGTLERLMSMPLGKLDLLIGYALAFALVATIQASVASAVAFGALGLSVEGPVWLVVLLAVGNAILGVALGLLLSAFATTEFQAVQFMPAVIFPQLVLCGLFVPRDRMAGALEALSSVLPMSYAFDALTRATLDQTGWHLALDALVVLGAALVALTLGATTLRRRTP
jgi:ribosome-dependent ATPase